MSFFTWLTTKRKTLATMGVAELRAQELLLESDCKQLSSKVTRLAKDKQKIVERGSKERVPELRRTMAQEFDVLHLEQSMLSRQLNIRSKERITVTRLRMLRENAERTRTTVGAGTLLREQDMAVIAQLIENEQVPLQVYEERLDELLRLGQEADAAGTSATVSPAAEELLRVWSDMDAGLIKDANAASDEAERRVRERQKSTDA
jgi:hypothetical protein